jgi:RimJ/RimL family protein N-acetyltransferase
MTPGGPTLATERPGITLKPWGRHHMEALPAANHQRTKQFMTDHFPYPYTPRDADDWFDHCEADDPPLNFTILVDGVVAGGVGSSPCDDIRSGSAEIGWWLTPTYWSHGITAVAVKGYIRYCFEDLGLHRVDAGVFLTNPASSRVAEKAGLRLEGVAIDCYRKHDQLIDGLEYGLAKRDWQRDEPAVLKR